MLAKFNRIDIKYGVTFVFVALAMILVMAMDAMLVNSVKSRMQDFSGAFSVAISAVLNADRDLYQARLAEVSYLAQDASPELRASFDENAEQAYDRMQVFAQEMEDYSEVMVALEGFSTRYATWAETAAQVFALRDGGESEAATAILLGESLTAFESLREIYNDAGEAVDAKVRDLEALTVTRIQRQQVWVTAFAVLVSLAAGATAIIGPHLMSRALREVSERIREITDGDGDLTQRLHSRRGDEIGELAVCFDAFLEGIDDMLSNVRRSARKVDAASDGIASSSGEIAERTEQSADCLHETSASMEEITITVRHTRDAARQADGLVADTVAKARRGSEAISEVEKTMEEINNSAARISAITSLIDGIAFQTNILALNASVEAARAGEHGRGFAVVAQEVRTLAESCGDASHEIRDLVDSSVKHTRSGSELVANAGRTMCEIVERIERVSIVINEISNSAGEQSQGIDQVNKAVTELDAMTHKNASMVEESSKVAAVLRREAGQLMELLARFKLAETHGGDALGEVRELPQQTPQAPRTVGGWEQAA